MKSRISFQFFTSMPHINFQMYNRASKQFAELPFEAESYGLSEGKGKGKGKGKGLLHQVCHF